MTKLDTIENKDRNTRLEFTSGILALIISLIFVFSNHIAQPYQIYYVIVLFFVHQIIQSIIFNRWNFNADYKLNKIWLRIAIIIFILILTFFNFATIHSDFSYNFNLPNGKKANTFYSVAIYCGVYFIAYSIGLKRIKKNKL